MAGRPTRYKAEYVKQAKKLCELGATIPDLAEAFGVAQSTVSLWGVKHKPFSEALKIGKDTPDSRVERSLYERAIGYSHPDVHISNFQGEVTITPITKHYPPDTKAALAWLYNRKSAEWHPLPTDSGNEDETLAKALLLLADKLPG